AEWPVQIRTDEFVQNDSHGKAPLFGYYGSKTDAFRQKVNLLQQHFRMRAALCERAQSDTDIA
ncbi:hypothetical protein MWK01_26870, partial [Escherichia coli]|nr:hypothetical protein [Escherichia coli]MCL7323485.1 hypothetical protein [Escherichia coli]